MLFIVVFTWTTVKRITFLEEPYWIFSRKWHKSTNKKNGNVKRITLNDQRNGGGKQLACYIACFKDG